MVGGLEGGELSVLSCQFSVRREAEKAYEGGDRAILREGIAKCKSERV